MAPATHSPPNLAPAAADSHERAVAHWRSASSKVRSAVQMSQSLHTLRSMNEEMVIPPERLLLVKRLGEGAFATVDLCWYTPVGVGKSQILVAVKHLKPHVFQDEANLAAFIREAGLLQKIRHSSIIGCYGVGALEKQGTDSMYVVEEYMAGGTLKNMVFKQQLGHGKGTYKRSDALRWCVQIAKGLAYLHTSKPMIIHRDLKLENILLAGPRPSKMSAKIADFGLAATVDNWIAKRKEASVRAGTAFYQSAPKPSPPTASDTTDQGPAAAANASSPKQPTNPSPAPANKEGSVAGGNLFDAADGLKAKAATFAAVMTGVTLSSPPKAPEVYRLSGHTGSLMYMAPEVYRTEPYNEKADVFSFGLLLLEVVTGHVLSTFMAPNGYTSEIEEFAHKMATENFRPPVPATVPQAVANLVRECWSPDPKARPSMTDVAQRLKEIEAREEEAEEERRAARKGGCGCFGG